MPRLFRIVVILSLICGFVVVVSSQTQPVQAARDYYNITLSGGYSCSNSIIDCDHVF